MICDIMKVKAIAEKGSRSWAVVLVWRTCPIKFKALGVMDLWFGFGFMSDKTGHAG